MAVMRGLVNPRGEPIVLLRIEGLELEVVVDTGFNGSLAVPQGRIPGLRPTFTQYVSLADGTLKPVGVASGKIHWCGVEKQVEITVLPSGEPLLGTEMLVDCKLEIDFRARTVLIDC